jgi:hypothetical protein
MHLGALVLVLSALRFREIMTLAPFDAVAAPEPSTCTGSGLVTQDSTARSATRR